MGPYVKVDRSGRWRSRSLEIRKNIPGSSSGSVVVSQSKNSARRISKPTTYQEAPSLEIRDLSDFGRIRVWTFSTSLGPQKRSHPRHARP
jgi:hypothetical protein